jgi:hypothetical protein
MPIEIKELVIRAVVDDDDDARAAPTLSKQETARLVEACVREVLRIVNESKER